MLTQLRNIHIHKLGKDIIELQQQYPDLVKVKTIGKSEYGLNIYAISLGKGSAKVFSSMVPIMRGNG